MQQRRKFNVNKRKWKRLLTGSKCITHRYCFCYKVCLTMRNWDHFTKIQKKIQQSKSVQRCQLHLSPRCLFDPIKFNQKNCIVLYYLTHYEWDNKRNACALYFCSKKMQRCLISLFESWHLSKCYCQLTAVRCFVFWIWCMQFLNNNIILNEYPSKTLIIVLLIMVILF